MWHITACLECQESVNLIGKWGNYGLRRDWGRCVHWLKSRKYLGSILAHGWLLVLAIGLILTTPKINGYSEWRCHSTRPSTMGRTYDHESLDSSARQLEEGSHVDRAEVIWGVGYGTIKCHMPHNSKTRRRAIPLQSTGVNWVRKQ